MENNPDIKFEILQMSPTNTNSVLVSVGDMAVIFDPWGRADDWDRVLMERKLKLHAIYATHGHSDHISAAPYLSEKYGISWFLNNADNDLIMWGNPLLEYFEIPTIESGFINAENLISGITEILPGVKMHTVLTPGHSAGSVVFYFPDFDILIAGDTIFRDGVGRTDLPGGNTVQLHASIQKIKEMNLPDETYVVHGHGIDSTVGWLRQNHPAFLSEKNCNCCDNGGCCGHHCCGCKH